ncbi:uncharacterized protein NP_3048A [Natronomonas pharaonis DSM 2160]|uniref:Uncharacterized protein n=1 Tax=Natronomonas pharaonis (strain ATCC 35678 / DSM 2160 / CIP 103997 / JCM 8858 / NBRC 14720 / NCIMB 2260 / Gabara) TaxID=348780 RepID=A0A1U7EWX6_NATPD|nr:hypothetical protein [Natronomonas pharaonis]CAI49615.1 uncharacterized protein NP_3048A [Natronomonas pharaonis DSM 2160]
MDPARVVTYGFVYAAAVFFLQWVLHPDPTAFEQGGLFSLLSALIFGFLGLYRRFGPETAERKPESYGLFVYGFVVLLVLLSGLTAASLVVQ